MGHRCVIRYIEAYILLRAAYYRDGLHIIIVVVCGLSGLMEMKIIFLILFRAMAPLVANDKEGPPIDIAHYRK